MTQAILSLIVILAVILAVTRSREQRALQRRIDELERRIPPLHRPVRCPRLVETTALVSCELPPEHDGPCVAYAPPGGVEGR